MAIQPTDQKAAPLATSFLMPGVRKTQVCIDNKVIGMYRVANDGNGLSDGNYVDPDEVDRRFATRFS